MWLNYPNNPTGAVAPLAFLEHAADLARRHDVLLALDEAYSELWFDDGPPASGCSSATSPTSSCSTPEQALEHDGLSLGVHGR